MPRLPACHSGTAFLPCLQDGPPYVGGVDVKFLLEYIVLVVEGGGPSNLICFGGAGKTLPPPPAARPCRSHDCAALLDM